jgi:hypothetical protein
MTTTTEILDAMKQAAVDGVQSTSFGAGTSSMSAMSIQDQITALRFAAEVAASTKNHRGIVFKQIQPCGARNDS